MIKVNGNATPPEESIPCIKPPVNVFPYMPPPVLSDQERIRMEMMGDLNKWAQADMDIARNMAQALIETLQRQFDLGAQGTVITGVSMDENREGRV